MQRIYSIKEKYNILPNEKGELCIYYMGCVNPIAKVLKEYECKDLLDRIEDEDLEDQLDDLSNEISDKENEIESLQGEIEDLQSEIDEYQSGIERMKRYAQEHNEGQMTDEMFMQGVRDTLAEFE